MIPATQTGFAGGVPITTAVTGGAASFWQGPPVKFQVMTDTFVPVISASPATGGSGYAVGDIITLPAGLSTSPPTGAPVQLVVAAVTAGAITAVTVVSQVYNGDTQDTSAMVFGGSYFAQQTNPVPQGITTGAGTGAAFNLSYGPPGPQRVILTNQEFATLVYCQDINNPDVFDDLFQNAFAKILGATVCMGLVGDKQLANGVIQEANASIAAARAMDGNEGLTVNDITPDWLRIRGIEFVEPYSGPYSGFDWGGLFPLFG
jgi:hypothetical protein